HRHSEREERKGQGDRVSTEAGAQPDFAALLRSREYLRLLLLAAALGLPISAIAYGFLTLVHYGQEWVFTDLPHGLGYSTVPTWWPFLPLVVAGVIVGAVIRYAPGEGGHRPALGFKAGLTKPRELPGVAIASIVGLSLGVVLGPESPLIAIGGG